MIQTPVGLIDSILPDKLFYYYKKLSEEPWGSES